MTTQTRRVYIPVSNLRPEVCFEVTRTDHPNGAEYTAEMISGDVDMDELVDAEALAIDQARDEWGDSPVSARITADGRFVRAG